MLVLGPGSTHLVTAAKLLARYGNIESCVNFLLIHSFSSVNAWLLITCDTAFYAIIEVKILWRKNNHKKKKLVNKDLQL